MSQLRKLFGNLFDDLRFRIDAQNLAVRAEQLHSRINLYPTMLLSQFMVDPLFVWLMWSTSSLSHQPMLLWLVCLYTLHLLEFYYWLMNRNASGTVADCRKWSRIFFFSALMVGSTWGIGTILFFPAELLTQVLMVCIVLGLAAGAVVTNAIHPPSLYAYVLSLMLPLTFRVLNEDGNAHLALGLLLIVFLLVILVSGHFFGKLIRLSLHQRFENQSLAQQLVAMNSELEQKIEKRTAQLRHKSEEVSHIRDVTILAMGTLAEIRDNETGNHLKRTQHYVRSLAVQMSKHPRLNDTLSEEYIETLYKLAPLHDIGKVGIPDHVLLKPGKLTTEEFEIMKTHSTLGGDVLSAAESNLPAPSRFLHIAREIATGHHEKWDGSGYPLGLTQEAIPLSARLMAVADVYDALISQRVYKKALTHKEAVEIITQGHGTHFDPDLIDAFLLIQHQFRDIAESYRDEISPA